VVSKLTYTLPDDLVQFVEGQVALYGYKDAADYVCSLIRREKAKHELRLLIEEGMDSPLEGPMDATFFDEMRRELDSQAEAAE
jgi:antitoxin ParD1/3/4